MKQPFKLFIFCFCISLISLAQEYKITGSVLDAENAPVVFAHVILMKSIDSTIVNGTSTDDQGKFMFDNVLGGKYILKASYIENISTPKPIDVFADGDFGVLTILDTQQQLDEVVVSYKKPTLERKVDRLVFNVANTAIADGTIWELLKQTPNVNVVQGILTIRGSSNVGVMINGRKINLPEADIINLLSGSSASNVEAIEVITNPPLKYSAEGGMLIDIKMKKNLVAGYNGAVYTNYDQGVFPKNTIGTDHYFKGKKTRFSINYSFNNAKSIRRYTDITNFFDNGNPNTVWVANQDQITRRKRHNVSAFFDYDINTKNTLSFSTINVFTPFVDRFSESNTRINNLSGDLLSSFDTGINADYEQLNTSFYGDWVHKLKKKGAEISVSSHYTIYDAILDQGLNTNFFDAEGTLTGENNFTTQSDQKINLYSLKSDFISPIGKKTQLEAGVRYAGIASENSILQEGFDRNQPGINPTESAIFSYDESIYAAYTSMRSKWNLWTLKAGLRAEYTQTKGELDTGNGPNKNSYLELFPSLGLRYVPSKKHQYSLSYYRRIERPRYSTINPFQYFQSNNTVVEGNPDLLPGTRHWVSAEYTYDRDYSITFFYLRWNNLFQEQTFQDNTNNLLRFINTNTISTQGYGVDLTIHKDISKAWRVYAFFSLFNEEERFTDIDTQQVLSNELWSGFARFNNSVTLLKDKSLVADLNFLYYAPKVYGNSTRASTSRMNLNFRKTLWRKNASISVGIEDIFNESNIFTSRKFLNQNNSTFSRMETRLFTLGFRYKFGNVRIKNNKKRIKVDERKRI